jgi:hypothetical protein
MPVYCDGFQVHYDGHAYMGNIPLVEINHGQGVGFVYDHEETGLWPSACGLPDNEHYPVDELIHRSDRQYLE